MKIRRIFFLALLLVLLGVQSTDPEVTDHPAARHEGLRNLETV